MPKTSQLTIPPAPGPGPIGPNEDDKDKLIDSCAPSHAYGKHTISSDRGVVGTPVSSTSQSIQIPDNIRGNFHQGEDIFQFRGVQCMAIALVALAKHTVSSVFSWDQEQLDWVLLLGDQLYTGIREAGKITEGEETLMVSNLPVKETIDGQEFEFRYGNGVGGDADVVQSEAIDLGIEFSLHSGLEVILAEYRLCLFTLCGSTCAIIIEDGRFAVVDSHSRSATGMPVQGGKSVVCFGSLGDLENHLCCLAECYNRSDKPFELQGVVVKHLKSTEEQPESPNSVYISGYEEPESPKAVSISGYEGPVSPKPVGISAHKIINPCDTTEANSDLQIVNQTVYIFPFNPLSDTVCQALCQHLNIQFEKFNISIPSHVGQIGIPCQNEKIVADGSCYFRAISQAVSGTEKNHRKIRLAIIRELEKNAAQYQTLIRDGSSVADYINKSNMRRVNTWATEIEIQATANYLGVDIFTFLSNRWIKYKCNANYLSNNAIYLENCHGNHYETVVCVKIVDSQTCYNCCQISKGYNIRSKVDSQQKNIFNSITLRDKKKTKRELFYKKHKVALGELSQIKYKDNLLHKEKVKTMSKIKYKINVQHREKKKTLSKMKYEDEQHREKKKMESKRKYEDEQHREKKKMENKLKYEDEQHREKMKMDSKLKYEDEQHREKKKMESKVKYEDEQHREKKKMESKLRYEDEQRREKKKMESKLKYRDEQHREKKKMQSKLKYEDEQHREKKKMQSKLKYEDEQHREKKKMESILKYRDNLLHRQKVKSDTKLKYSTNPTFRAQVKNANKQWIKQFKKKKEDIDYVIDNFLSKVKEGGPEYVCCVCYKLFFKQQVKPCNKDSYNSEPEVTSVAERCISDKYLHRCTPDCPSPCRVNNSAMGELWICATCNMKLRKGQMPAECHLNNLELDPIPPELECLNSLEHHLCCPTISFIKAIALPKGGQNAAHGPATCVPANVLETTTLLPRTDMEGVVIPIKLKRKLSYKGYYEFQFADPMRIREALRFLKQNNKHFSEIEFNEEWVNIFCQEPDECPEDKCDVKREPEEEMEDELLHDNQRHCIIPDTCLMPVDPGQETIDHAFTDILNLAPAEGNHPLKLRSDEDHEAKCFPKLFPFARNTFHTQRRIPLTLFRYLLNRIMHADRRFAHNTEYIFFALSLIEVDQVVSKVSIASRKGHSGSKPPSGKNVKDSLKEMLDCDAGYHFLHPIRGTPSYWQNAQKDLLACLRQLGLPTWFCSFSSADLRWGELLEALLKIEGSQKTAESLTWEERCDLLRRNSVVAAQMFDRRWHAFLNDVILSKAAPIGIVVDYFYRVEFQQRGSPHVHCLFWVEGAPRIGVNPDEEVVAFVDKYVTCKLPKDDEKLLELVTSVQQHSKRHSKTCKKGNTVCRFNFPRPPSMRTFIKKKEPKPKCKKCDLKVEDETCTCLTPSHMPRERAKAIMTVIKNACKDDSNPYSFVAQLFEALGLTQATLEEALKRLGGNTQIILKRELDELYINNWNEPLLEGWEANMDIQLVTDPWACIVYIISYISKAERQMGLLLRNAAMEAKKGNLDAQDSMKKIGTVYLHNREVSAQEAVYRLSNMHLKECSRKVVFVPTGDNIVRLSRPIGELSDSTLPDDMWMTNLVDRYKNRPKNTTFNDMCMCTFASEYRVLPSTEKSKNAIPLQNGLGSIVKRTRGKPAVVRYARFSETKNPEVFHQSLLQLFLPYRDEDELKPLGYENFQQFFANGSVRFSDGTLHSVCSIVEANRNKFEAQPEDFDDLQEIMASDDLLEDAWGQLCPEQEVQRLESEQEVLKNQQREDPSEQDPTPMIPDLTISTADCRLEKSQNLPRSEGLALIRSLNEEQLSIFYKIRQWCVDKALGKEPEVFHVFITGGAGTGKSHLIRAIHYEATRLLAPTCSQPDKISVLLTAPTGIAAYNLNAATIHSTFNIGINTTLPYCPLGDDKLNSLRAKYSDLLILIIDEISMVHHKLMTYIHGRLRQIKQSGDFSPFGKVCIIAVGDFYQLSPVYGKALFVPLDIDFWNGLFKVAELKTIMRQKDVPFAQLLNRLRLRSKGTQLRRRDLEILRQRETGEESSDLHIFAKRPHVYAYNIERLKQIDPDYITMYAQDFSFEKKTGKFKKLDGHLGNATHTNLEATLEMAKKARVMLCKNVDPADGLVNGVCGTVTHIENPDNLRLPVAVYVTFDDPTVGAQRRRRRLGPADLADSTRIEPEEEIATRRGEKRRQFPLTLAWAITVHKVQGMTLDRAVVSLKEVFTAGQAYVALSRVRSLEGLIIQDLNEELIYCNDAVKLAMEHMPPFIVEPAHVRRDRDVTVFFINVRGLVQHISDLAPCVQKLQPNVCAVAETWLTDGFSLHAVQIERYSFYSQPRSLSYQSRHPPLVSLKSQQHGGVGLYCDDKLIYEITVPPFDLECLAFHCPDHELIVAAIYRPPSYPMSLFRYNLERFLCWLSSLSENVAVVGDFNENLLKSSNLSKFMLDKGYTQHVSSPTTERGTLIDHVYVKSAHFDVEVVVMPTYYSDHEGLFCSFKPI